MRTADFAQQVALGARGALLDGALGQDAGLGPFQRTVQVGKGAHMFTRVFGGQGVERRHGGGRGLALGEFGLAHDLGLPLRRPGKNGPTKKPPSLAGMGNYLVGIFKDTPMLSVIGVTELMQAANSIGSETYRFLEPYTLVGLIFLALSLPTAGLVRLGERRLRRKLGL